MEAKTKKTVLIIASIFVLGGVGYYLYKRKKDKNASESIGEQPTTDANIATTILGTIAGNVNIPNELNTIEKVKAFQDWMDIKGPWIKGADNKWRKLNKGAGYGNYGPATKVVWARFGAEYLANPSVSSPSVSVATSTLFKPSDALLKDIDTIVANGTGLNSDRNNLMNLLNVDRSLREKNILYIKSWAKAIRDRIVNSNLPSGGAFTVTMPNGSKMVYESYTGTKLSNNYPVSMQAFSTGNGYSFYEPDRYSNSMKHSFVGDMGIVKAIKYNKNQKILFLYVPDMNNSFKWTPISAVTLK